MLTLIDPLQTVAPTFPMPVVLRIAAIQLQLFKKPPIALLKNITRAIVCTVATLTEYHYAYHSSS